MKRLKKKRRDMRQKDLVTKKAKRPKRLKPLKFLLNVINDPNVDQMERIKAALAALPYCHAQKMRKIGKTSDRSPGRPRMAEEDKAPRKLGKKETKQVEAQSAVSSGRFRPMSPPNTAAVNGASH